MAHAILTPTKSKQSWLNWWQVLIELSFKGCYAWAKPQFYHELGLSIPITIIHSNRLWSISQIDLLLRHAVFCIDWCVWAHFYMSRTLLRHQHTCAFIVSGLKVLLGGSIGSSVGPCDRGGSYWPHFWGRKDPMKFMYLLRLVILGQTAIFSAKNKLEITLSITGERTWWLALSSFRRIGMRIHCLRNCFMRLWNICSPANKQCQSKIMGCALNSSTMLPCDSWYCHISIGVITMNSVSNN